MELWEAIEIYMGREVDFTSEVILIEENNQIKITWNILEKPQPLQQELDILITQVSPSYKYQKIIELQEACNQDILKGFYSSAKLDENGNPIKKFYPFKEEDQANMTGQLTLVSAGSTLPIYWKALDEPIAYEFTKAEFLKLCEDAAISRQIKMITFQTLRKQVNDAVTKEEVDAIIW